MPRTARLGSILAIGAILALSGCAGTADAESAPAPTPTAPASPASSPAPSTSATATAADPDPLAGVVALVVRPQTLELRDAAGGVVDSLDYMSDPAESIAVLTDLFDEPPVVEPYEGTNHTPPGTFHSWGDLVVDERHYDEERREGHALDYVWPRFAVYFDGPDAGGLELSSEQGFHATDDWTSLAGDPVFDAALWTCVGVPVETLELTRPDERAETATVVATASEDETTVEWLGAPVMIADGCA
ncbi:hypothetical protein [Agromyces salentinus]|uniref:hypothetical protein n=1 Tax=Agromyces salentinus TaxID=269421 RepID=UPI0012F896AE|nr:hypothetical protein [Agromyces salentinus]